ncbi:MAG: hypothetical protein ACP5RS_07270 [Thermoplasmata archaeon]
MEFVSLNNVGKKTKIAILKELGYDSDGTFVLDKDGNKVLDKYTGDEIKLDNMAILPGSTIVLNEESGSVLKYLEEYGDDV